MVLLNKSEYEALYLYLFGIDIAVNNTITWVTVGYTAYPQAYAHHCFIDEPIALRAVLESIGLFRRMADSSTRQPGGEIMKAVQTNHNIPYMEKECGRPEDHKGHGFARQSNVDVKARLKDAKKFLHEVHGDTLKELAKV